jgi:hypothetical protein
VLDSHPTPGSSSANLNDAAWTPSATTQGDVTATNGDIFTDCGNATYSAAARHIDNYVDPNSADQQWHFEYQKLKMLVTSLAGVGSGSMTAGVKYTVVSPCLSAPTAAGVTVAGRVTDESGRGLRGAIVSLTSSDGISRTIRTSSMGYFSFDDVTAGQTYVANVTAAGREFDSRPIHVGASISNLDFSPRSQ